MITIALCPEQMGIVHAAKGRTAGNSAPSFAIGFEHARLPKVLKSDGLMFTLMALASLMIPTSVARSQKYELI